jgi:hypothetical protein
MTPDDAGREIARGFMSGLGDQNPEVTQAMDRITRNMNGAQLKPSVGRIVHYVSHGSPVLPDGTQAYTSECRAAIVTEVTDPHTVGLMVANPTGQFFRQGVVFDDDDDPTQRAGGSWHWPERAE